jgi:hypothetical protein
VDPEDEQVPYQYEFTVTPAFRSRVRRALVGRALLTRPVFWATPVLVILIGLFFLRSENLAWIYFPVVVLLFVLVLPLIVWIAAGRSLRRTLPDGAVLRSGFGVNAVRIKGVAASVTLPAARIVDVRPQGDDLVWVRLRDPRQRALYARALFPDDETGRIRGRAAG